MVKTIYFIRGDNEFREVIIDKDYDYFRINWRKRHPLEELTAYISGMIAKGWRKATLIEYIKNKYRRNN